MIKKNLVDNILDMSITYNKHSPLSELYRLVLLSLYWTVFHHLSLNLSQRKETDIADTPLIKNLEKPTFLQPLNLLLGQVYLKIDCKIRFKIDEESDF